MIIVYEDGFKKKHQPYYSFKVIYPEYKVYATHYTHAYNLNREFVIVNNSISPRYLGIRYVK